MLFIYPFPSHQRKQTGSIEIIIEQRISTILQGARSRHDNSETKPSFSVLCRSLGRYIFVIGGLRFYEACLRITKCRHQRRERGVSRQDVDGFPRV